MEAVLFSYQKAIESIIMSQRKSNNRKESTVTPTKASNPSPVRAGAPRSPLTASNYKINSGGKQSVSYGELQIVLENIQQIRKKAAHQVQQLSIENQRLRQQLFRQQQEYQNLQTELNRSMNSKTQIDSRVYEQIQTLQIEKDSLFRSLTHKQAQQQIYESQIQTLRNQYKQETLKSNRLEGELSVWKKRWQDSFNILAGESSRSEQLIGKVRRQCSEGVWRLFENNDEIRQAIQMKNQKLQIVQRELAELKASSSQSTALLEKSMSEISSLHQQLLQKDQQFNKQRQNCIFQLQQKTNQYQNSKGQIESLQRNILNLQQQIKQLSSHEQNQTDKRGDQISYLRTEILQKQKEIIFLKQKSDYETMISEVCQESEDYSLLLGRLSYLQKFKQEHYQNIQKIQFLCKQLDN